MSSLFSVGGSIDIPAGRRSGRARGKFGRMAGEIVKAIGDSSPTVGLAVEPRDKGEFGTIPRPGINPPSIDENKIDKDKSGSIGGMIGGTSPIPGVSGHEYLNNPKYAEHAREYYGKKNKDRPEVKEEDIKKKPLPNIGDRRRRKRKAVDDAVSFSRRIPNRSEEDRRRNRKRRRGGNIPSGEQQPVGSGYTPFMLGGNAEDLIGIGKDKNKTNMPTFGKMVYT